MACGGPPCAFLPTASGARDNAAIDFEDGQKGGKKQKLAVAKNKKRQERKNQDGGRQSSSKRDTR